MHIFNKKISVQNAHLLKPSVSLQEKIFPLKNGKINVNRKFTGKETPMTNRVNRKFTEKETPMTNRVREVN